MEFGLFFEFPTRDGVSQAQVFDESFALVDAAEELGTEAVWLAEYHFEPERSVLSAPITIASAIAARTKRMKVGTAVCVIPLRNPLRVAEEIATLDHISGGRLDFGIGRSALPQDYLGYGMDYRESRGRFHECLEVILRAWTMDRFSYEGEFYSYHDVSVSPKPLQQPHPPIRIGVSSAETFAMVGRMGYPVFINPTRVGTLSELAPLIKEFKQARREAGFTEQTDIGLRLPIYVAETAEQAYSQPRESTMYAIRRLTSLINASAALEGVGDDRVAQAERLNRLDYDTVLKDKVVYGTPESVTDQLRQLQEDLGINQLVYEVNFGSQMPLHLQINAVRLLNERVVPRFK
jgi:alkanesulfonate monooxygenase SsuD/methylene tetrahydromethanopterin reductase-like flavin-dependent oxidoreductase (luciferase family)